ncbi:MAG: FG-GAP-like repeat-containing protein [Fuerstiella sp.]
MGQGASSNKLPLVVLLLVVAAAGGFFAWQEMSGGQQAAGLQYRSLMNQAKRLAAQGKAKEVEALCREAIGVDAERPDAYLLAAECARARAGYADAIDDLQNVLDRFTKRKPSEQWLSAAMLQADILHYNLADFGSAEQAYQSILKVDKNSIFANTGYARLLGLCGCRRAAIPLVLSLIKQNAAGDLLVLLSREEGAISDSDLIDRAISANPDSALPWVAKANVAILALDHSAATKHLRTAIKKEASAFLTGRLGRQLLLANEQDELQQWAMSVGSSREWAAETWMVMGQLAEQSGDTEGAIRCYWESLRRWPESLEVTSRMVTCLQLLERSQEADVFRHRAVRLTALREAQKTAIMSSTPPTADDLLELVESYAECGRLAEAVAWGQASVQNFPANAGLNEAFHRLQQQIARPLDQMTEVAFNVAADVDFSNFAIPTEIQTAQGAGQNSSDKPTSVNGIRFRKQTNDVGFDFTYFNGCGPKSHRTFGFTGGGLGVFDLDADAWPDLICTQGIPWIEDAGFVKTPESAKAGDTVFRNRAGRSLEALPAEIAFPNEADFGQGVAVGDVNEDGFPDLYVANAKRNRLWVNNGDGTFSDHGDAMRLHQPDSGLATSVGSWTTSCMIADLNGDQLPDLYDVNYLAGDDVFTRICQQQDGQNMMCGPEAFEGASDRVLLNDGQGNFVDATQQFLQPAADGKGLGIVAFSDATGRLNLFVANDTVPNHLFVAQDAAGVAAAEDTAVVNTAAVNTAAVNTVDGKSAAHNLAVVTSMVDEALVRGVAVNADGKSEACMGIAVSDFDDDQRMDIVVTNFLHETNTLYHSITDELLQDQTRSLGLREGTLPILSFGTQFLDANNDGFQELFFGNGYTQDLPGNDIPYAMQSQLFQWNGDQFQQLAADTVGAWGQQNFVARSVTRWDWNADGLPDLAVGLLHEPSFLLTNESAASEQTGLTLKLVATGSARDAIGATVTATVAGRTQTAQVTAGDGYQCSNERIVWLSGRRQAKIPTLTIRWPSGNEQTFSDIPATGHWVAVEGRGQFSKISRKTN